ncbi:MAG: hypothetical protein D6690_08160 [Nitrospirae bacterium]|nr:MAG: hypothetical protein D6690_08160 [Nitrospirota bacterium]
MTDVAENLCGGREFLTSHTAGHDSRRLPEPVESHLRESPRCLKRSFVQTMTIGGTSMKNLIP